MIVRSSGLIRRTDLEEKEGRGRSSELHLLIGRGWPCSCDTHVEQNSRVVQFQTKSKKHIMNSWLGLQVTYMNTMRSGMCG
jgi:hypothetical protein